MKETYYLSLDFEKIGEDVSSWDTFALVLVRISDMQVVSFMQVGNPESNVDVSATETIQYKPFWQDKKEAVLFNLLLIKKSKENYISLNEVEKKIVWLVRWIKENYKNFWTISDNPAFDIRLLDNILHKHHESSISIRSDGSFFQPICTWSFKRSLGLVGKRPAKNSLKNISTVVSKMKSVHFQLSIGTYLRHTPLFDSVFQLVDFHLLHRKICS